MHVQRLRREGQVDVQVGQRRAGGQFAALRGKLDAASQRL
jgi:hypothetical protein